MNTFSERFDAWKKATEEARSLQGSYAHLKKAVQHFDDQAMQELAELRARQEADVAARIALFAVGKRDLLERAQNVAQTYTFARRKADRLSTTLHDALQVELRRDQGARAAGLNGDAIPEVPETPGTPETPEVQAEV